jgi:biopolymer transport protein TolR
MNVTPLVDVVLVLLIIFMVVIPAMEQGLNIEVPGVAHADEPKENGIDPFILSVSKGGTLYLDQKQIPVGQLEALLKSARDREPSRRLVLRGDRGVRYGEVREVLATVQRLGFPGMSLRVNRRSTDSDAAASN